MKKFLTVLGISVVIVAAVLHMPTSEPLAYKFIELGWDPNPPEDNVTGYVLYMGERSNNHVARFDFNDPIQLTQRVLVNHPVTFYAIAAKNAIGEGPKSDELVYTLNP